jgi:hypothetical protein
VNAVEQTENRIPGTEDKVGELDQTENKTNKNRKKSLRTHE